MHLRPDIDTYVILPWTPEEIRRARIICDVELPDSYMEDPRMLKEPVPNWRNRAWSSTVRSRAGILLVSKKWRQNAPGAF